MKIESRDRSIKKVLDSGYFHIPRFQRPYSWQIEQVEEFWQDVIADSQGNYFIGSFVVFVKPNEVFGVIDGQQRLTTITLALCSIRDKCDEHNLAALANGLHRMIERKDLNDQTRFVVRTETSYPFFQQSIQARLPDRKVKKAERPEEKNLEAAFEYLKGKINGTSDIILNDPSLSERKKAERIREALTKLRDQLLDLQIVITEVDNEDDAYVIFETLNTRGQDLRLRDQVNAHITRLFPTRNVDVDTARDRWRAIVNLLEDSRSSINPDAFIHHHWLSRHEFVAKPKVFKSIRKGVGKPNAEEFLSKLEQDGERYRSISEPGYRKWKKAQRGVRESLTALDIFGIEAARPLILSLLTAYDEKRISLKNLKKALQDLENFHFCYTAIASQSSSGGTSRMYSNLAVDLTNGKAGVLAALNSKLKARMPSEKEFVASFSEVLRSSRTFTKSRRLVRYALARLHESYAKGGPHDYDAMTVEHLIPQSDSGRGADEELVASIGNLLLVPEAVNGALEDKSYVDKRKILMNDAADHLDPIFKGAGGAWGKKEIEKRTKWLADRAFSDVWTL